MGPLIFLGLALVGLYCSATKKEEGDCPEEGCPPPDEPPPSDLEPNPPGDVYDCVDPTRSALLIFRAFGDSHPQRVLDTVEPSEPREVSCFVANLNRSRRIVEESRDNRIVVQLPLQWSNFPPDGDLTMTRSRALGAPLSGLFIGQAGDPFRAEGDWYSRLRMGGLDAFEPDSPLSWMAELSMNPKTCDATMSLRQGGDETDNVYLPVYREENCPSDDVIGDLEPIVVCDNTSRRKHCETVAMTAADRVELFPFFGHAIAGDGPDPFYRDEGMLVLDRAVFEGLALSLRAP